MLQSSLWLAQPSALCSPFSQLFPMLEQHGNYHPSLPGLIAIQICPAADSQSHLASLFMLKGKRPQMFHVLYSCYCWEQISSVQVFSCELNNDFIQQATLMSLFYWKQALCQNTPYPYPCAPPIHTSLHGQSKTVLKTASFLKPHARRSCFSDPTEQSPCV